MRRHVLRARIAYAFALLVALLSVSPPTQGSAQAPVLRRPALHWVRGPGAERCAAPRALALAVEELVGPVLVRASEAESHIEGHVELLANRRVRVLLRVVVRGGPPTGERVLEHSADDCAALTPALAFVIAMMIDPGVAAHGLPPSLLALLGEEVPDEALLEDIEHGAASTSGAGPSASSESTPAPPPPAPLPPPPPPRARDDEEPAPDSDLGRRTQASFMVQLGFREVGGKRPLVSGQQRLLFPLRGPLAVAAHVRGGAQIGGYEFQPGRELRMSVLAAGVSVCAGQHAALRLRVHGCVGPEFSGTIARGQGLPVTSPVRLWDAGVLVQATARLRIHEAWGLLVMLGGRVSLVSRTIYYLDALEERQRAYQLKRFTITPAAGVSYEF